MSTLSGQPHLAGFGKGGGIGPFKKEEQGDVSERREIAQGTRHQSWTKITWDLSQFSEVDFSKITYVELHELEDGTYYFDKLGWE